jgi:imidazolonepropionase-like amidohydrolase
VSVWVFNNCSVFDGHSEQLMEPGYVVVDRDRIREVSQSEPRVGGASWIDCDGGTLMPGLIDAHFHACAPTFDMYGLDRMPPSFLAQHGARSLSSALRRGFTSVRDAGGADIGLAMALERGLIQGPRLFYSGRGISQTGGHGDNRPAEKHEPCSCRYSGVMTVVADGVDEVRRAVREELRLGATQIKIHVSGGVTSPTDTMWMPQFCEDEIRVAVAEAKTRRTYVMAHCHTDDRARACVEYGVRTIEHGTEIEADTAALIAASSAFVVPTLSVVSALRDHSENIGLSPASLEKLKGVYERTMRSMENCVRAGVRLGLGTDLLGDFQGLQGGEFALRAQLSAPFDVLRSATSINAQILQRSDDLGRIAPSALADILVVRGNPLRDIHLLGDAERNLPLIMKNGQLIKNELRIR